MSIVQLHRYNCYNTDVITCEKRTYSCNEKMVKKKKKKKNGTRKKKRKRRVIIIIIIGARFTVITVAQGHAHARFAHTRIRGVYAPRKTRRV